MIINRSGVLAIYFSIISHNFVGGVKSKHSERRPNMESVVTHRRLVNAMDILTALSLSVLRTGCP